MSNFIEKKTEKTDDPDIFADRDHCRQMERQTKPNLYGTSARVGV